ncbi:hypothetical protein [Abyssicoccus albus]|uniref:Uncharacterized protein n=1 Tax=Abyssicoccus albus TaxID=1817405 RepID=A0A3N5BBM1_9BACL|nr:hypothetical protein [Abyssicoccus albus]RPF54793.1 hypothetical protein EDD62_1754 [Abyssicoccus albus]
MSDYMDKNIEEWNVRDFHGYMNYITDKKFGVKYAPMRSWKMEQGMLGNIVGTKTKEGSHDKRLIKAFIDLTFSEYKPTDQYPAPTFGFVWTYRQSDLQRVEKSLSKQKHEKETKEELNENKTDIDDWLLS